MDSVELNVYNMEKVTCLLKDFSNPETGRVYSKEAMEKAVKEYMSRPEHQRLGEISRDNGETFVSLAHVTHRVENMAFMGNKLYCEIELLDTPEGKMMQEIVKNGHDLKLTPRAMGNPVYELDENGNPTNKVVGYDKIDIISIDIVE